ncbi:hypothetical protein [Kineosporia babensis]|uniref:Uncharacterized protein n=1 Tax=Kineosporia babensis TaxID=499548 RepID=A0A9X1NJJ3_9ACTN|nr:hypothetical protein [Kineosporia babensis]MCD5316172.1 hypothetical protein [Kineosporia babensis]
MSDLLHEENGSHARLRPSARTRRMPRSMRARDRTDQPPSADAAQASAPVADLNEWHAMTEPARSREWSGLVGWVRWLHDAYELSVEERLPLCWYQHPGLVEELRALKAWREEIYRNPPPATAPAPPTDDGEGTGDAPGSGRVSSPGAGQAARYWHAELRQVLHAAGTQYAPGCPAGHRGATLLHDVNPDLHERWIAGNDGTGAPAPLLTAPDPGNTGHPSGPGDPMLIEHTALMAAVDDGRARSLGALVQDYVQFEDSWWTRIPAITTPDNHPSANDPATQPLWQKVVNDDLIERLDRSAERLRTADDAVKNQRPRRTPERPATS